MPHEVVQEIKPVKYNRRSHEMISVTCKRIPTMVNKEMHKNEHSHEMTRFLNRIVVWSSLHELVLVYGSSHSSVFESPMYRVHNEHESDRVRVSCSWVRIARTGPKHCNTQPTTYI